MPVVADPALETLILGLLGTGQGSSSAARILFLRARGGACLPSTAGNWTCEQSFRPFADSLCRTGLHAVAANHEQDFDTVLVLPPRQREESRALLARALLCAKAGGWVVASVLNSEGARSTEADLERLAGSVVSLSKNKCRVLRVQVDPASINHALVAQWRTLDAPRPIAVGRFVSRPGLFAWDRIDAASVLLAASLPASLSGKGADLGAGFGYLSAEVLRRCPGVTALDLFEAEARALDLARLNLAAAAQEPGITLRFHWHDVARGIPSGFDFIVCNPPFHQGRADQPELGQAFIATAAAALRPGGDLWMVANRHLPYEAALARGFARVSTLRDEQGFKVIKATRANP